jgi:hypothetical protein
MSDNEVQRFIVAAANRSDNGMVVVSARHFDLLMHRQIQNLGMVSEFRTGTQGFIDQFGTFVDRFEALAIAEAAGQINVRREKTHPDDRLFSEDLY